MCEPLLPPPHKTLASLRLFCQPPKKINSTRATMKERASHLGDRVELSEILLSFPPSFGTTLIWSPPQTLTTVPSNVRPTSPCDDPFVFESAGPDAPAGRAEPAYKLSCFALAARSAPRSRSIPPPDASIPACQSRTRPSPFATRCSATFPAGWRTKKITIKSEVEIE